MGEDEPQLRITTEGARHEQVDDGSSRLESEFHNRCRNTWQDVRTAGGRGRVDEYDGTALIQGTENAVEHRMAQVSALVAGEKNNTVCVELIERVVQFSDGRRGIRDWYAGKKAEPAGMLGNHFRGVFIRDSGEAGGDCRVTSPDIRGGERDDSGLDRLAIHFLDRTRRSPAGHRGIVEGARTADVVGRHPGGR